MTKLCLLLVATALGCRDSKKPADKTEPARGSAAQDPGWIDRLPEISEPATKLSLDMAAGLVGVKQDGSIVVAKPPAAAADPSHLPSDPLAGAEPVQLADLTKKLGIAPVAPRKETAYAPTTGSAASPENVADAQYALLGHPSLASGAPTPPKRATSVFALEHAHEVSAGVIVFADASAPASVLVDVLAQTGGFLAVRRGRDLGAMPLAFDRQPPAAVAPDKSWTEVRLGKAIEVETVPSAARSVGLDKLADVAGLPAVDVLVSADTKVSDLLAAVGSLRAAKVEALGFGRAPAAGSPDAAARGEHGPRVLAWDFATQGPGDVAALRAALDGALEPIRACYAKELTKTAQLTATAHVQFLVRENTQVASVEVRDAPKPLVTCVATAVKAAKFPTPSSPAGMAAMATLAFLPK